MDSLNLETLSTEQQYMTESFKIKKTKNEQRKKFFE